MENYFPTQTTTNRGNLLEFGQFGPSHLADRNKVAFSSKLKDCDRRWLSATAGLQYIIGVHTLNGKCMKLCMHVDIFYKSVHAVYYVGISFTLLNVYELSTVPALIRVVVAVVSRHA